MPPSAVQASALGIAAVLAAAVVLSRPPGNNPLSSRTRSMFSRSSWVGRPSPPPAPPLPPSLHELLSKASHATLAISTPLSPHLSLMRVVYDPSTCAVLTSTRMNTVKAHLLLQVRET